MPALAEVLRGAIEDCLRTNPGWTDARIARIVRASHVTIGRIRAELVRSGAIPDLAFVMSEDGRAFYRGRRDGSAPALYHLSTLRSLVGGLDDPCWHRAAPAVRREFGRLARHLAERAAYPA